MLLLLLGRVVVLLHKPRINEDELVRCTSWEQYCDRSSCSFCFCPAYKINMSDSEDGWQKLLLLAGKFLQVQPEPDEDQKNKIEKLRFFAFVLILIRHFCACAEPPPPCLCLMLLRYFIASPPRSCRRLL